MSISAQHIRYMVILRYKIKYITQEAIKRIQNVIKTILMNQLSDAKTLLKIDNQVELKDLKLEDLKFILLNNETIDGYLPLWKEFTRLSTENKKTKWTKEFLNSIPKEYQLNHSVRLFFMIYAEFLLNKILLNLRTIKTKLNVRIRNTIDIKHIELLLQISNINCGIPGMQKKMSIAKCAKKKMKYDEEDDEELKLQQKYFELINQI